MINIAICDDDKYIVSKLEQILLDIAKKHSMKVNVEVYYDGSQLEHEISKGEIFHLIFLDIEMQQDGILTAKRICKHKNETLIIFFSNYEKYFRELFEVGAFRFLDKPIEEKKVEKYFIDAINVLEKDNQYFVFRYKRGMIRVRVKDILYFESNRRKVLIHKVDGTVLEYYEKLNDVEKRVRKLDTLFLRTHQSFLVNSEYVERWKASGLELEGGIQIPISEEQQKKVHFEYSNFIRKDIFNE